MFRNTLSRCSKAKELIGKEANFSANNYSPLPVVFSKCRGVTVQDPDGVTYMDFLAGYGSVNQGHLHPRLVKAATQQLSRCTLSSRAFYNDKFADFAEVITKTLKYERVLPMNTGAEAVETAIKLARRWGYERKNIPKDKAIIICVEGNFHGRTMACISLSDDPSSFAGYGPMLPGFVRVPFGDAKALAQVLKQHGKNVAGFLCEPIQGECGVNIPPPGYLKKVQALCKQHNVLYMSDEVQSGLGRTGKLLATHWEGVRPDVVILAKALGGGIMPVSAVLADSKVMSVFTPGTHGSTFGGNPVASAVGQEAIKVLVEEGQVDNAARLGVKWLAFLKKMKAKYGFVEAVRCRGLWAAIDFPEWFLKGQGGYKFMNVMKELRILCKVTRDRTIRMSPPLCITDKQLEAACECIDRALAQLEFLSKQEKSVKKLISTAKKPVAAKKPAAKQPVVAKKPAAKQPVVAKKKVVKTKAAKKAAAKKGKK